MDYIEPYRLNANSHITVTTTLSQFSKDEIIWFIYTEDSLEKINVCMTKPALIILHNAFYTIAKTNFAELTFKPYYNSVDVYSNTDMGVIIIRSEKSCSCLLSVELFNGIVDQEPINFAIPFDSLDGLVEYLQPLLY